jgi:H+/Cl- antiporter ClcA
MKAQLIVQVIVCCFVVFGFFGVTAVYVFNAEVFAGPAKEQLYLITGAMMSAFGQVVNWALNSTIGSARKTELLAQAEPIINLTEDCTDAVQTKR